MFFGIIIYVITGLWVLSIEYPERSPVYFTFINIFYESICLKPPPKSEVVQVRDASFLWWILKSKKR
jgi:RsiW-degrading membrane proteinase PrsW (M82 family)